MRHLVARYGDDIPLDVGAAAVACREDPDADPAAMLAELDRLARGLRLPPGELPLAEVLARLQLHLFGDDGFRGDHGQYDHPDNSCLHRVLERRRGLPITLSIVYIEVARRRDLEMLPIGFPGHFLVRPNDDTELYVDPFHQGRVLRPERLRSRLARMMSTDEVPVARYRSAVRQVPGRYVLVRMLNNLKGTWLRRNHLSHALRAVEGLRELAPELHREERDRGVLLVKLGREEEGRAALEAYLQLETDEEERARVQRFLSDL